MGSKEQVTEQTTEPELSGDQIAAIVQKLAAASGLLEAAHHSVRDVLIGLTEEVSDLVNAHSQTLMALGLLDDLVDDLPDRGEDEEAAGDGAD